MIGKFYRDVANWNSKMDVDLGGTDLKHVRYQVLFAKQGDEVTLREGSEIVAGDITGATFVAQKKAEFLSDLERGQIAVPLNWDLQGHPPNGLVRDGKLVGLPVEDLKYIEIYIKLTSRYVRDEPEYAQDQVRALKELNDLLGAEDGPLAD